MIRSLLAVMSAAALTLTAGIAFGQDQTMGGQVGEMSLTSADVGLFKKPSYSPYAGRRFPTQVFWGDTHLHTSNSLDARAFGATLGPEQAYRFARGEEVTSSHGMRLKLSRPLDWLVIADHSDGMGAMNEIIAGNPQLLRDPTVYNNIRDVTAKLKSITERIDAGEGTLGKFLRNDGVYNELQRMLESFRESGDIARENAAMGSLTSFASLFFNTFN